MCRLSHSLHPSPLWARGCHSLHLAAARLIPRYPDATIDNFRLPYGAHRHRATVLNPGDVLYIPRGWSHVAEAESSSPSLHMTMTLHVQDFTWESLLRFFVLTGEALATTDAGFELGHGGLVDLHSGGGSPAASYAESALKTSLRAPSACRNRPKMVGVPGKSVSHEMVLVVALHEAANAVPGLRAVHAPAWSHDGDTTAATMSELVGFWEAQVTVQGLEAVLECDSSATTLDKTLQV